jgi:hypothetical protein
MFYTLDPEVAGGLGPRTEMDTSIHPPNIYRLNYEMDGLPGDELLTSFPCYIVTANLRRLIEQAHPTGCSFDDVEITVSDGFLERIGQVDLPQYFWLKVTGKAGRDDFGMSPDYLLVVSERILAQIRRATLTDCIIAVFN